MNQTITVFIGFQYSLRWEGCLHQKWSLVGPRPQFGNLLDNLVDQMNARLDTRIVMVWGKWCKWFLGKCIRWQKWSNYNGTALCLWQVSAQQITPRLGSHGKTFELLARLRKGHCGCKCWLSHRSPRTLLDINWKCTRIHGVFHANAANI